VPLEIGTNVVYAVAYDNSTNVSAIVSAEVHTAGCQSADFGDGGGGNGDT